MEEIKPGGSVYDKLAPELIERAYVENDLIDLEMRRRQLAEAANRLDGLLRDRQHAEFEALVAVPDIASEAFVDRYRSALELVSDRRELQAFDELASFGERAAGFEPFIQDLRVEAVGADKDGTALIWPGVTKFERYGRPQYAFRWSVVTQQGRPRQFFNPLKIGQDTVFTELVDVYDAHRQAFRERDQLTTPQLLELSDSFETIGQQDRAKEVLTEAKQYAMDELLGTSRDGKLYAHEIADLLEVLDAGDESAVDEFLDRLSIGLSEDDLYYAKNQLELIQAYLEYLAKNSTTELDSEIFLPTRPANAYEMYMHLLERGKRLRLKAADDQQTENA